MSEGHSAAAGMDAFARLHDDVRQALSERGFSTPTAPQRKAIPTLAAGESGLVVAPTGSGKTETAMLPVLSSIQERPPRHGIQALYITPLRALNRDMRERLEWWGETLGIDIDVRHGDTTDYQRQKQAEDPPDVLVTTPETLQAMFTGEKLRRAIEDIEHIVVDEVHELAGSKRGAQLTVGLEHLREHAGPFQRIGLSATVGDPTEVGRFLTGDRGCHVTDVEAGTNLDVTVRTPEIRPEDRTAAGELLTDAEVASHVRVIDELVDAHDSVLIFVNTRQTAEGLGSRLKAYGTNIGIHHGSLSKSARIDVEDAFKTGEIDGLMCTSSMELGIDVGDIDHVIQYASPREVRRLLQRVGRAGHRRDETSSGTVITTHPDDTFEALSIVDRAERGAVESAGIHHGSLDTVANQIAGLLMGFEELPAARAYEILTRAYPFRNLPEEQFKAVVRELSENRILWLEEGDDRIEKSGGTWQYFYANLSMIPDEANYTVTDMASGDPVGTLAERFVVTFAEPGETFVQGGEMWRITEIDDEEEEVLVSPIEDPTGEVPSWVGQEIPVPRGVAEAVATARADARGRFDGGDGRGAVARSVADRYPTDEHTASEALKPVEAHKGPIPTPDRIVVEGFGRQIVLNAAFGHTANETLGRLLSALIGQQTGGSVAMEVDPYRIELEVPSGTSIGDVVELLETTDPDHVPTLVELSLKNAETLKFTLAQVAAKFGALKRWKGTGSSQNRFGKDRLLAALEDTPIYDEAVRVVLHEQLDVDGASDILSRLQSGDIELATVGERTALGQAGRSSGRELLSPENADASVVETVKERILDDDVLLACLHCKEWDRRQTVKRVDDQPECPLCGSTRIAALNPWADEVLEAVRTDDKDDDQQKATERAYKAASIVQSHGKRAVIALAARGVGPRNAAYIINNHREEEADFYRDIIERERQYARTKSFWD
ncbi:ATP-dependent DNA helicase [Natronomonas pharaonis DSM 2160]|uniref:ATP-dependent DNA helicase n=1 Tax=Natronomonas pharaonis (strain ATCC 35678 / DSM 2160 / CIP 103997 / JCM 8858 / NBRC 14720 / NCIMB 2260 / Gabara) TaxID=348780 RepID=A0A1U7EXZ9_NATPD|nr:DEAD/DEAH box helicase [Natronomonas pharaonis]CAI50092.2 ATP-dependent DNA helicase [Natronomonas pharaonis DSM 2160]